MKADGRREKLLALIGVGVGLVGPTAAHADVHFNGFGQVVVGSTLDNNRHMPARTNVADYSADPNFRSESLFALQAQAALSDQFSATAQIVADGAPNNVDANGNYSSDDFQPKFAWAYATWTLNDNWSVKGGRQRLPLYHYSDYLQVGEAYPWIRPPIAVYTSPVSNYDGVSLNGSYSFGDWYVQPQVYYGGYSGTVFNQQNSANVSLSNLAGVVLDATYSDWLEFRASYHIAKLSATYDQISGLQDGIGSLVGTNNTLITQLQAANALLPVPLFDPTITDLQTANPQYNAVSNMMTVDHQTVTFASAGLSLTKYNFVLDGEYTWQKTPSYLSQVIAYYVSLGYRMGPVMPYLTYSRARGVIGDKGVGNRLLNNIGGATAAETQALTDYATACTTISGLGGSCSVSPSDLQAALLGSAQQPGAVPQLYGATAYLVNTSNTVDNYYEAGIRYDVSRSTALKLDYTYYASPVTPTSATGYAPSQGPQHGQLLSAAFVFTF